MPKLLIATNNAHKYRELAAILGDIPYTLTSLAAEGITLEVEEAGRTYAENATLKARAYATISGLLTLADDSGLEVEALGGEPGLRSARYAGEGATNPQRIAKLLSRLEGVPWERRRARFICVIAIATPQGDVHLFEGICQGVIAFAARGEQGFGYDPIFYLPEYGCTMAELPEEEKNRISHRAQAGMAAARWLRSQHQAIYGALGHGQACQPF